MLSINSVLIFSINLALLSFVAPQVNSLGHGVMTTIPALVLSGLLIAIIDFNSIIRSFTRFRFSFFLGFAFIVQAAIRFALGGAGKQYWDRYVVSPSIILIFLLWVSALGELGEGLSTRMRTSFILFWGISLSLGIPALFNNPGVLRLTMGNTYFLQNAAIWAPQGVGEYTTYSAYAICAGPMLTLIQGMPGPKRVIGYIVLAGGMLSVLLCTLSMAAFLLAIGFLSACIFGIISSKGITRRGRVVFLFALVGLLPTLAGISSNWSQTTFVIDKISNLVSGISTQGLSRGDETERGSWFSEELETFAKNPLIGHGVSADIENEHGHSSLSNGLVLFGLLGSLLWISCLGMAFWTIWKGITSKTEKYGHIIVVSLLFGAGVLNPSWHSSGIVISIFALIMTRNPRLTFRTSAP